MDVIEEHVVPDDARRTGDRAARVLRALGWVYQAPTGSSAIRTARTSQRESHTVQFEPTVVGELRRRRDAGVAKIVGVSDDYDAVAAAESAAHDELGDHVSASRSQPYYLDVTHPQANKGASSQFLSERYASRRRRSRRSATCPTTCSCSRTPGSRSRWGTRIARCSARRGTSRRRTTTTASRTPSSGSS